MWLCPGCTEWGLGALTVAEGGDMSRGWGWHCGFGGLAALCWGGSGTSKSWWGWRRAPQKEFSLQISGKRAVVYWCSTAPCGFLCWPMGISNPDSTLILLPGEGWSRQEYSPSSSHWTLSSCDEEHRFPFLVPQALHILCPETCVGSVCGRDVHQLFIEGIYSFLLLIYSLIASL